MKMFGCTIRADLFVVLIAGSLGLAACGSGSSNTQSKAEVIAVAPANGAQEVLNTISVSADFDRAMNPSSLSTANFTVACPAGTLVAGTVNYVAAQQRVTFKPDELLPADTQCAVELGAGVIDAQGVPLSKVVQWSFSTVLDVAFIESGKSIFRYDTFGDETLWSDTLRMHEVIGSAVDPITALTVGLKVDAEALPAAVVAGIQDGSIDLHSPATTVALIKLDAVVGVKGTVESVDGHDTLTRVGITCALCHSTVDNSFAPGIGKRLDGWPNRDLIPGTIIALSPALTAEQKAVYSSWPAGMYDPRYNIDGLNGPQVISPAYGLKGIHRTTSTGDGENVAYWNRYVGVTQMGGHGSFYEPRTGVSITNGEDDLISAKLPALQAYQLTIEAPPPPADSFDSVAAARGQTVFNGAGRCSTCHSGPEFTDANERLHQPNEVVSEPEAAGVPSYASRTATRAYRTAPLKGIWQHPPYFHNGSAATLEDVVALYDTRKGLGLSEQNKADLVQYLKSL
ncbi:MAG TPA: Ig-like domain-containing protein [Dokdonella sp.]|uniref:Ig-like domain-containing protein n=1 Tax=Dokdonella sp. TaxID=2291710 RepID=UPI002D803ABE|nr:Ig-like domain-containing protein [Dokdonella sp.]HET9031475.1 Ig-like domain-containing protein [Dokdonella sp.]